MFSSARRFGIRFKVSIFAIAIWSFMAGNFVNAQDSGFGRISGRVLDESSGFGVSGATIAVSETGDSTTTDLRGSYSISGIAAGTVTLVVSKEYFNSATITGVSIPAGGVETLEIPLPPSGGPVIRMEAFTIAADIVQSSDIGLLAQRQKAVTISDAISSDQLSRPRLSAKLPVPAWWMVSMSSSADLEIVIPIC